MMNQFPYYPCNFTYFLDHLTKFSCNVVGAFQVLSFDSSEGRLTKAVCQLLVSSCDGHTRKYGDVIGFWDVLPSLALLIIGLSHFGTIGISNTCRLWFKVSLHWILGLIYCAPHKSTVLSVDLGSVWTCWSS